MNKISQEEAIKKSCKQLMKIVVISEQLARVVKRLKSLELKVEELKNWGKKTENQ